MTMDATKEVTALFKLDVDEVPPTAAVASPAGGEYWVLSEAGKPPKKQMVSWSMSDDVRICRVRGVAAVSNDGGTT